MNITQFKKMIALHGADFSRWEGVDPKEARDFLDRSAPARKVYEEAARFDFALDSFAVPAADPVILERVMKKVAVPEGISPAYFGEPEDDEEAVAAAVAAQDSAQRQGHVYSWYRHYPALWGGAVAACAAAIVLYISFTGDVTGPAQGTQEGRGGNVVIAMNTQQPTSQQDENMADTGREVLSGLMDEMDRFAAEAVEQQEIIGMFELAMADIPSPAQVYGPFRPGDPVKSRAAVSDDEVEAFLDEIYPEMVTEEEIMPSGQFNEAESGSEIYPQSGRAQEDDMWELFLKSRQSQNTGGETQEL